MADKKITDLAAASAAALTQLLEVVTDPGGTPASEKLTIAQLKALVDSFGNELLHVEDQKTANTNGGTFTQDAWQTRVLNTAVTNGITGASLSSNQITLPAGTYFIEASAPGVAVDRHKLKLRNTSDSADTILGRSVYSVSTEAGHSISSVVGTFTIAGEKTFELQHYCQTTAADTGFGVASNFSVIEVYSQVKIWKVG